MNNIRLTYVRSNEWLAKVYPHLGALRYIYLPIHMKSIYLPREPRVCQFLINGNWKVEAANVKLTFVKKISNIRSKKNSGFRKGM